MTNEELWAAGKLPELWEAVARLLYQFARKFYLHHGKDVCSRHGVTLEDLQQECYFAFLDAVRAYNPEKGFRFTSYLSRHAQNRFRACMGIFTKLDALNYADSMNTPTAEDSKMESGGWLCAGISPSASTATPFPLLPCRVLSRFPGTQSTLAFP